MKNYYFAGGGTGGHIYPALAVARELKRIEADSQIKFFCSQRPIDARILSAGSFEYTALPIIAPSSKPVGLIKCVGSFIKSRQIVKEIINPDSHNVVVGIGGFVSVPVVLTAKKYAEIAIINIDAVPGKANKLLGYFARIIFVQFESSLKHFQRSKVTIVGCPLRAGFDTVDRGEAIASMGLNPNKSVLLITGASGGAVNINNAIGFLLDKLNGFADKWQIVHIAGISNVEAVRMFYKNAKINHKIFDYCDDIQTVLACADLAVGRAGAGSIAEFAATLTPSICLPYPYHDDRHQELNAQQLEKYTLEW